MTTEYQAARLQRAATARKMYESKVTFAEIARRLKVHPSTARRLAEKAGVVVRNRDEIEAARNSSTKQCKLCNEWKDKSNFYHRSDDPTRHYSYCKSCDSARSTEVTRRSRMQKRQQAETIDRERRRFNSISRKLLLDAVYFLETKYPDATIVSEILAHLSVGKKLFGDDTGA